MTAVMTKPKERPILFSGPMVRAILEGRKTVTRRVVKSNDLAYHWDWNDGNPTVEDGDGITHNVVDLCPYGKPGDILWVRETFSAHPYDHGFIYRATDPGWDSECVGIKWRPSIFMPRAACRLKLRITDVRVERLQDIGEQQAMAEGVESAGGNFWKCYSKCKGHDKGYDKRTSATASFMSLWDSINEKRGYGWDLNPFVWVVEFEKLPEVTNAA